MPDKILAPNKKPGLYVNYIRPDGQELLDRFNFACNLLIARLQQLHIPKEKVEAPGLQYLIKELWMTFFSALLVVDEFEEDENGNVYKLIFADDEPRHKVSLDWDKRFTEDQNHPPGGDSAQSPNPAE